MRLKTKFYNYSLCTFVLVTQQSYITLKHLKSAQTEIKRGESLHRKYASEKKCYVIVDHTLVFLGMRQKFSCHGKIASIFLLNQRNKGILQVEMIDEQILDLQFHTNKDLVNIVVNAPVESLRSINKRQGNRHARGTNWVRYSLLSLKLDHTSLTAAVSASSCLG